MLQDNMDGFSMMKILLLKIYMMIFIYYKNIFKIYSNFKLNFLIILDQISLKNSLMKMMKKIQLILITYLIDL